MKFKTCLVSLAYVFALHSVYASSGIANTLNAETDEPLVSVSAAPSIHNMAPGCMPGQANTSNAYLAVKWYRDSAEKNAQYNQVFKLGMEKVLKRVKDEKLAANTWGVILDVDETVLDNTLYEKNSVLSCQNYHRDSWYEFLDKKVSVATPGAMRFTCGIKNNGGIVALVTNRNGHYDKQIVKATVDNLNSAGICFDTVVFADADSKAAQDKNAHFNAVVSGKYTHEMVVTNKLKAFKVLAYFGDNIQDFPHMYQKNTITQDPNGDFYAKFGEEYFSLPNPTYGSWLGNKFK